MTPKNKIVIATGNKGKAAEFKSIFKKFGFEIQTLLDYPELDEIDETGDTFAENALLKAEGVSKALNTIVLADDSGLKVDALQGQPGIYSARFAGEEKNDAKNNAKLLGELSELPFEERTAHFHCTLALAAPDKESMTIEGELDGYILGVPRGQNGFGYDPLFYVSEKDKTLAELTHEEKNNISHRAIAVRNLEKVLENWINN
ncbi:XTP/dITP diphosphatase [Marinilactibacillus psychrotolerans]|uniref:dITP/XTP pyrophosphatase n=1 Tax=Marinilactibacillus psychrotolerans TaxID=191770 RepID=A0A5R9C432_9LACT|nr:XTP/dITP diphosphatase [Marinilactibacillus psychrotolerans]